VSVAWLDYTQLRIYSHLQGYQFVAAHGEVCPANWKPGKDTIKPNRTASMEFFAKQA